MVTRRHGQALIMSAVFILALVVVNIYNKEDPHKKTNKIIVVPGASIVGEKSDKLVADTRALTPEAKPASLVQQATFGGKDYRVVGMLPGNGLFDLSGQKSFEKCQQNSCRTKLYYRRDVTRADIAKFMVAVQEPDASARLKQNGLEAEGMTFGIDEESNSPYFEIFTRKVS